MRVVVRASRSHPSSNNTDEASEERLSSVEQATRKHKCSKEPDHMWDDDERIAKLKLKFEVKVPHRSLASMITRVIMFALLVEQ